MSKSSAETLTMYVVITATTDTDLRSNFSEALAWASEKALELGFDGGEFTLEGGDPVDVEISFAPVPRGGDVNQVLDHKPAIAEA